MCTFGYVVLSFAATAFTVISLTFVVRRVGFRDILTRDGDGSQALLSRPLSLLTPFWPFLTLRHAPTSNNQGFGMTEGALEAIMAHDRQ